MPAMISTAMRVTSMISVSEENEQEDDQEQEAETTRWTVAPTRRPTPGWQRADSGKHENDQKNCQHTFPFNEGERDSRGIYSI